MKARSRRWGRTDLEFQALIQADPGLEARLRALPGATFSGRKRPAKSRGLFLCYALPALDKEKGEFTEEAGTTRWYLHDLDRGVTVEEPGKIRPASIRSEPKTPRCCTTEQKTLVEIRELVQKHIKNTYLKRVDAPLGVKPTLRCWMELNEG